MDPLQINDTKKLSNLQLELLKLYSTDPTENDLKEIKNILAKFFFTKLSQNINQSIEQNNITNQEVENWLNEDKQ